jgi:hypothetical protein
MNLAFINGKYRRINPKDLFRREHEIDFEIIEVFEEYMGKKIMDMAIYQKNWPIYGRYYYNVTLKREIPSIPLRWSVVKENVDLSKLIYAGIFEGEWNITIPFGILLCRLCTKERLEDISSYKCSSMHELNPEGNENFQEDLHNLGLSSNDGILNGIHGHNDYIILKGTNHEFVVDEKVYEICKGKDLLSYLNMALLNGNEVNVMGPLAHYCKDLEMFKDEQSFNGNISTYFEDDFNAYAAAYHLYNINIIHHIVYMYIKHRNTILNFDFEIDHEEILKYADLEDKGYIETSLRQYNG